MYTGTAYIPSLTHPAPSLHGRGETNIDTTFSIYSNRTGVHFYTSPDNYTFMAARYINILNECDELHCIRCSECVKSEVCGWCQLDFTCTESNTSCTTGDWLTVSHFCLI